MPTTTTSTTVSIYLLVATLGVSGTSSRSLPFSFVFLLEPIVLSLLILLEIGRELLVLLLHFKGRSWLTVAPGSGLWFDVMIGKGGRC